MSVSEQNLEQAVNILTAGGLVAFPTETVYGVGALASKGEAVDRVFDLKGRPRTRPLSVHLHHAEALDAYAADIPDYARTLVEAFWPGSVTLVLRRQPTVLDEVTGGSDTVGVRVPSHPVALAMLKALANALPGVPAGVAAPSANKFGEPPATNAADVAKNLGEPAQGRGLNLILDGGDCPGRVPSTVLSCVGPTPRLLRRGAVELETIQDVLGVYIDQ